MKRLSRIILSLGLVLGSMVAFAQGQALQNLPNDPAVKKGQLDNGLTYYIRHNALPEGRAEFYLATNVGAIQETPDQDGLAHFLEHMCFNGTKNFPDKKILDYLQSIGASFGGNVNASTGVEQTIYMLNNIPLVNDSVIDTCILIMHDYSHFVLNSPEEIDKERGVIIEERRQRRNAQWRLHEQSLPYYYGDSKYGSCTLIGSQENLETFKPESLVNFYQTWYHPDMQALVVVGDIDPDAVEQKIKRIFSDIPKAENPKPKDVIKIPENAEPIVGVLTDPEATTYTFEVLWKHDALPEEYNSTSVGVLQNAVKQIVSLIMDERFEDITAKTDAPFLGAQFDIGNLCETMEVVMGGVVAKEGEEISGLTAYLTEVEKMKRFGFSDAEVERAKANLLSTYETLAKRADTRKNAQLVMPLISNFFDNEPYMVPQAEYELMQQLLGMVPAAALNQIATQLITKENMVVLFKGPQKDGYTPPTEQQIRDAITASQNADIQANEAEETDVELLDPASLKGAPVKKAASGMYGSTVWMLKNGMKVILLPTEYEKDRISIDLFKEGGQSLISDADLRSFESNIWTLFVQNSGVSKFPSTQVSKMLAGKNVTARPYLSDLRHGITATSTGKDLETALQLVYLLFEDPRFDPNEYDQGMKTINAILPNLLTSPDFKMQKALYETLYGNSPRQVMLDEDVVKAASLQTIEKNYRALFNDAKGATAVIVGDFTLDGIRPLVEKYLGSISKGKKALKWIDNEAKIRGGNYLNDFSLDMQTPKTTVFDAYKAPVKYSMQERVSLSAASYILNMRYVTSLREDEGGTYGASASAQLNRAPEEYALLQIFFNCRPSSTDRLREIAAQDLKALAYEGPTAEEFDMTKKNLEKNIPERKITNSYWLEALRTNALWGDETVESYEREVAALTPEKIMKSLQTILEAENHLEMVARPGETAESE